MKRTDHDDIMSGIEGVYADISKRVAEMSLKRENVEKNVLSMIENVIDSYVRDTNKFKWKFLMTKVDHKVFLFMCWEKCDLWKFWIWIAEIDVLSKIKWIDWSIDR